MQKSHNLRKQLHSLRNRSSFRKDSGPDEAKGYCKSESLLYCEGAARTLPREPDMIPCERVWQQEPSRACEMRNHYCKPT